MLIAELCQNHNGDLALLRDLVFRASEAGASFCKIQSFFADDLSEEWAQDYERLARLELNWEQHARFAQWCKEAGVLPMTSVYTFNYAPALLQAGIRHVKIGSAQAKDEALIRRYITAGFHVTLSTGGHDLAELPLLSSLYGILHCVSAYPAHPHQANLTRMLELRRIYPVHRDTVVGFSDHTDPTSVFWDNPAKYAMMLGAGLIEKHFTVLPRDRTKDGVVSVNFEQLKELCDFDRLDMDDKVALHPAYGIFYSPQSEDERTIIARYSKRWKKI